jgi:exopolyphosphatase/guanosine-5'-triphosphate,3'-diphosphate pyrophosphatase
MNDEARATGLDSAHGRALKGRPARGRAALYRARHDGARGGTDIYGPSYAALDLGTNNCRLLIARATHDGFRVIDAFSRIIRLGEGITASGRLSEPAIARAVEALKVCRDKIRNRGAENCGDFLSCVREAVGIELEIVDRETEALLAASGCTALIDPQVRGAILFDIGGGSSELVKLARNEKTDRGPPKPKIEGWISLPLGVVTIAERHGGIAVTRESFERMIAEVAAAIAPFAAAHGLADPQQFHLLGTSGTVTTIAGVHLNLRRYDRRRVDGCWMSEEEVSAVVERLLGMSYDERIGNPCIGAERADLVLAGCAILEAIRRAFPCKRLCVADRGLREGMLVTMMRADGVWGATE